MDFGGERFIATGPGRPDFEIRLESARKVPTRLVPNWILRVIAHFDPELKAMAPELGKRKNASNEKARRMLGWSPRDPREAILAIVSSLSAFGLS